MHAVVVARGWPTAEAARDDAADHNFSCHGAHDPRFCNPYRRHAGPCPTEGHTTT